MTIRSERPSPLPSADALVGVLALLEERVRSHHSALWEEEKHYTWLLSLLLPAIGVVFATTNVRPWVRSLSEAALCVFGLLMSRTAVAVIAKESQYMQDALELADSLAKDLSLRWTERQPGPPSRPVLGLLRGAPQWLLPGLARGHDARDLLGIRDGFRLTFEIFFVVFLAALLFLTALALPMSLYPT